MLTILLTIFVCILVPVYTINYGIRNFLWFSDIGLFLTVIALWFKSPLIISMAAVGIFIPEIIWCVDFFVNLLTRHAPLGLTKYMFDKNISLFVRLLSLFHLFLPVIWIVLLSEWGYDARAIYYQTGVAWLVLILTYRFTNKADNINWVFTPEKLGWKKISAPAWLIIMLILWPVVVMLPAEILFWFAF
jgi:hypothetical protein